jgi:hypothetical protein
MLRAFFILFFLYPKLIGCALRLKIMCTLILDSIKKMKHQYSININSLEPQLLGYSSLLFLLMNREVHPKLFFKKSETLKCEYKFAFPKHNDRCAFFWPTYYITYSSKLDKFYKIKCVELLGTSLKHIENLI